MRGRCVDTYVQLLIIARPLLARGLELLAHLADFLVRLSEFGGRHLDVSVSVSLMIWRVEANGAHS
jgi:hypothetical protein